MIIRPAAHGDLDSLVELGAVMHAEGAYAHLPYDPASVRKRVTAFIESFPRDRCFFVAEHRGAIFGFLAGVVEPYFFCEERVAYDILFFVHPQRRLGPGAFRLVQVFRAWAAGQSVREICLGISSGVATERVERFHEKLGMKKVGSIFKERLG